MNRDTIVTKVIKYSSDHGLDFKELLNLIEDCTIHILQSLTQNVTDVIDDITIDIIEQGSED